MDPKILERGQMNLIGMTYYGPIGGEGWSEENQIGQLWQRFNRFCEKKWVSIEDRVINPKLGYEVSIWNEDEFKETGDFCIFVGVEVEHLEEVPLELFGKVLPAGPYAYFTLEGKEITVGIIGDTPLDMQAGCAAGCCGVIGVLTGAHGIETLGMARHTHIIRSVADLPVLLEKEFPDF